MSQNEKACPSCAALNRMYAMRLIGSGCNLSERDNITSAMLSPFAFYFVTLTAPSFKATHTAGQCNCGDQHEKHEGIVSTPLDPRQYRYRDQIVWNRDASVLFHYTMDELKREIPAIEWTAVREWQKRGALHFHCIVRVPVDFDEGLVWSALTKMRTRKALGIGWGKQFDVKGLSGVPHSGVTARWSAPS